MPSQDNPGVDENLDDRYDEMDPFREGTHKNTPYRIYKIPKWRDDELVDSHYTGYIKISKIIPDPSNIRFRNLPHPPSHSDFNFGPTKDGWIGFGTLDGRDHNFTEDKEPLNGDRRIDEGYTYEEGTVLTITPSYLEEEIQKWINETIQKVVLHRI